MKALFLMQYPGYLRYFDGVVLELLARGHTVDVCFSTLDTQPEGLEALEGAGEGLRVLGAAPRRGGDWEVLAAALRRTGDYVRYLHPRYRDAPYLRNRMKAPMFGWIERIRSLPPPVVSAAARLSGWLERGIPSSERIEEFLRASGPDLLVVTPLVNDVVRQTDFVKSARYLGIRTAVGIASWDHLTTKGLVRSRLDSVIVWNDVQRDEAVRLHHVERDRIAVTGAQPFDRWFERRPSTDREAFCAKVGLDPVKPLVLFVGSTASISAPEVEQRFVRQWIAEIRASGHPALAGAGILIRPHPYNAGHWNVQALKGLDDVALWPRAAANPVNVDDRADYFDSMWHSAAVVGINTSAMIESAIVGRPVMTLRSPEFEETQGGTLHFHYLLPENGGFLRVSRSLDEHVTQLADVMDRPEAAQRELERFVESFVRPHGRDRPATPIVVDELERVAALGPATPERLPARLLPLRWWLVAWKRLRASGRSRRRTQRRLEASLRRRLRRTRKRARRLVKRSRRIVKRVRRMLEVRSRPASGRDGAPPPSRSPIEEELQRADVGGDPRRMLD